MPRHATARSTTPDDHRPRPRRRTVATAGTAAAVVALSLVTVGGGVGGSQPAAAAAATAVAVPASTATSTVRITWRTSPNLVKNSEFGSGRRGWKVSRSAALRVVRTGSDYVAKIKNRSRTSAKSVALNDAVNTVRRTERGVTYRASGWVRATKPGTSVALRLREVGAGHLRGTKRQLARLQDTRWHHFALSYVARTTGSAIDVNVVSVNLAKRTSFLADSITLVSVKRVVTRVPIPPAPAPPTGWRLVFADNFSGSAVDTGKWRVRNNTASPNERAILTSRPSNVFVSGGALTLRAQRETYTAAGTTRPYTSGYLETTGKEQWTYGRFEMRARLPTERGTSKGMWPAFWLRPADGGDGEIDIMEAIGRSDSDSKVSQTLWQNYSGAATAVLKHEDTLPSGTSSGSYHVYAVEWERGVVRWYVDNRLTVTRTASDAAWVGSSVFAKPYNIRLNLQVGGSWPGEPTAATTFPHDYDVDYVKVYQR